MKKRKRIVILALLIMCVFAMPVLADEDNTAGTSNIIDVGSGLGEVEADALADKILDIFTGIGYFIGVVAVGSLIYNAFRLATGDEKKRADAKGHILWTLGAVLLVGAALLIVGFVVGLLT